MGVHVDFHSALLKKRCLTYLRIEIYMYFEPKERNELYITGINLQSSFLSVCRGNIVRKCSFTVRMRHYEKSDVWFSLKIMSNAAYFGNLKKSNGKYSVLTLVSSHLQIIDSGLKKVHISSL